MWRQQSSTQKFGAESGNIPGAVFAFWDHPSSEGMSLIQRMTLERASKFYCFEQADTEFGGGLSLEDVVFFHAIFFLCFFFVAGVCKERWI